MDEVTPDEGFASVRCHMMKGVVHVRDPAAFSPLHSRTLRAVALHQDLKDVLGAFGVGRRVMQDVLVDLFYSGLIYLDVHNGKVVPSPDVTAAIEGGTLEHTLSREKPSEIEVVWVQEMVSGQVMAHQLVSRYLERPGVAPLVRPLLTTPHRLIAIESLPNRTLARAAFPILRDRSPPEETVLERVERITDRKLVGGGTFYLPLRTLRPNLDGPAITIPDVVGIPQVIVDGWTAALNPQEGPSALAATPVLGSVTEACFPWVLAAKWAEAAAIIGGPSGDPGLEETAQEFGDAQNRLRAIASRATELATATSRRHATSGGALEHLQELESVAKDAQRYLVVGSAFASARGFEAILKRIRSALERGVKVLLIVGLSPPNTDWRTALPQKTLQELELHSAGRPGEVPSLTVLTSTVPFHSKFVLADGSVCMISSLNWLSAEPEGTTWEASLTCCGTPLARDLASHIIALLPRESAFVPLLEDSTVVAEDDSNSLTWVSAISRLLEESSPSGETALRPENGAATVDTAIADQIRALRGASLVADSDHRRILTSAIASASKEVVITSDGLTDDGLGSVVGQLLQEAANRGVKLFIRWGRGGPERDGTDNRSRAEARVRDLRRELGERLDVNASPAGIHGKVVLVDGTFALVSSFNFLSFGGAPGRGRSLSGELGIAVSDPEVVESLRRSLDSHGGR
jgi:phosphatidylserine/phosphatidylglycerophosphate/cardiolipin synthase-like enzyme